jgi:hypothetical protein
MAKSTSTLKTMRAVSAVLFLAVAVLVAVGINQMRHWDILTGWKLIALAFVPLALLLGFTAPVMCKVKRTNEKACGHWAYGLLFGCFRTAGHWTKKFRARLRFPDREVKPVQGPQPTGTLAPNYQSARQQPQQMKFTVEDGRLGVCGFWVSVASLIAAVIPLIVLFAH